MGYDIRGLITKYQFALAMRQDLLLDDLLGTLVRLGYIIPREKIQYVELDANNAVIRIHTPAVLFTLTSEGVVIERRKSGKSKFVKQEKDEKMHGF